MEKKKIPVTARCPIRTTLELVGGKWKLLILFQLHERPLRFGKLKAAIPDISEKMLIQELKTLADSGLVFRKNYGEVPPRVEYSLTDAGKEVMPLIRAIERFGLNYLNALE